MSEYGCVWPQNVSTAGPACAGLEEIDRSDRFQFSSHTSGEASFAPWNAICIRCTYDNDAPATSYGGHMRPHARAPRVHLFRNLEPGPAFHPAGVCGRLTGVCGEILRSSLPRCRHRLRASFCAGLKIARKGNWP